MKSVGYHEAFMKMCCLHRPLSGEYQKYHHVQDIFLILMKMEKNKLSQICAPGLECEHCQHVYVQQWRTGRSRSAQALVSVAPVCPWLPSCLAAIFLPLLCARKRQNSSLAEKTEFQIDQHFPPRWWRRHHQGVSDSTHSPALSVCSSASSPKAEGGGMGG